MYIAFGMIFSEQIYSHEPLASKVFAKYVVHVYGHVSTEICNFWKLERQITEQFTNTSRRRRTHLGEREGGRGRRVRREGPKRGKCWFVSEKGEL